MLDVGRVIFLTGAPLSRSLGWTEEELCAPLKRGFIERIHLDSSAISLTDDKVPSWRSLPLEKPHLPTGLTQLNREYQSFQDCDSINGETSFLSTTSLSVTSTDPHAAHSLPDFSDARPPQRFLVYSSSPSYVSLSWFIRTVRHGHSHNRDASYAESTKCFCSDAAGPIDRQCSDDVTYMG